MWKLVKTVILPVQPKAMGRPRFSHGKAYTPRSSASYINEILNNDYLDPLCITDPVRLDIEYIFDRPQRLMRRKDSDSRIWKTTRPDIDNCNKMVMDLLTKSRTVIDDSQVVVLNSTKEYTSKTGKPYTKIKIFIWSKT